MKKTLLILFIVVVLAGLVGLYFLNKYKTFNIPGQTTINTNETLPFSLPQGFEMSIFALGLENARVIAFDPGGTMLVSQPGEGKISALPDENSDSKADGIIITAENLDTPHGMAFRCPSVENPTQCEFYVAEKSALSVFDYNAETHQATNKRKLLDLPAGSIGTHFTRTLLFMPSPNENTLLISVGSSCNVCTEEDERRASVISYNVVSKTSETFAKGLRNSVFMEIHPVTGAIWATEMGRDGLGDDVPPDEINILERGKNYGWPICYGKNIHDTDFDKNTYIRNPCQDPFETPSLIDIQAHSAPLGLAFFPEEGWPEEYWFDALVAYHGSWNRSEPTGYKIVRMDLDDKGNYFGVKDFITGFLRPDGARIGRPVDIKIFPGGKIYISDDGAGIIYQVVRR
jgi:glucose/arabinose dehydrogenase